MEKITALIDKLQDLNNKGAALSELAYYTQLLYAELMSAKNASRQQEPVRKKVAVIMPGHASTVRAKDAEDEALPVQGPKEKEPAAEKVAVPELLPAGDEAAYHHRRPADVKERTLFDHQEQQARPHTAAAAAKEVNEAMAAHTTSLNDRLKHERVELATKLTDNVSIADLSKAIGINDKFLFINELFRGDRQMFDRSVKTINECTSLEEAEYWIDRELKIKLGWQEQDATVKQFYHLVRKRFS